MPSHSAMLKEVIDDMMVTYHLTFVKSSKISYHLWIYIYIYKVTKLKYELNVNQISSVFLWDRGEGIISGRVTKLYAMISCFGKKM